VTACWKLNQGQLLFELLVLWADGCLSVVQTHAEFA